MPQQAQSRGNPIQDYITVAERIDKFYQQYPEGRITTHIIEHDAERGFILMRAEVYRHPDDAMPAATGHAFEYRDAGHVQRTSYIETGETSAVGRALALCGFEAKRGLKGREQTAQRTKPTPVTDIRSGKEQKNEPAQGDSSPPPTDDRAKLKSAAEDLIRSLSALGHPDFKKGQDQGARILAHVRKIAKERSWDVETSTLESINELTDKELSQYIGVLEGEINVWKERLADDGEPI